MVLAVYYVNQYEQDLVQPSIVIIISRLIHAE